MNLSPSDAATLRELEREIEGSRPEAARVLARLIGEPPTSVEYLTTSAAARLIGVTPQTVRNWIDRGWLRGRRARPWAHRRIAKADLDRLLEFRAARGKISGRPYSDEVLGTLLSRHREDRQRGRTGEPIAEPRSTRTEAVEMASRR